MTQQDDITQRGLIERLTEIANRDSAVAVTVRADDLRALLSKLRAPVADERAVFEKWTGYTEDALSRDAGDGYCIKGVDNQWRAWQASRAALASAPVAPQACPTDVCQAGQQDGVLCANNDCDRANGVRPPMCRIPGVREDVLRRAAERMTNAPVADERAALARLEAACDTLCRLRTQEQYLSMVDSGQQDALLELDGARAQARSALARAPVAKPKCAPIDDGIFWSSKEIQRRQKEEDDARAAYYHSRASAPVAGEAKSYPGDNVAERLDNMADDQPPGSQAQSDLYAAATIWRKHIAHRAALSATQAEQGERDA